MKFLVYSHPSFEPWDWCTPETTGIGGSETSHVEMCRRLAERGHEVRSFAPTGHERAMYGPASVPWLDSRSVENYLDQKGVWVIYRHPAILDHIPVEGNAIWLICQDIHYGANLTEERAKKLTRLVALCEEHAKCLRQMYPFAADKVCVSSNGIKVLGMQDLMARPDRDPHRMMYASSPDRGLYQCLQIFERVKEIVRDAQLHIYYGWDNMDKVISNGTWQGERTRAIKDRIVKKIEATGAVWHGRMAQRDLAKEWMKAGIWCHPNVWHGYAGETSCITAMDAQAYGAIPITNPTWAIAENVEHGVFVKGDPESESLVRAKYVLEVIRMMLDPERQETIRREMMPWARKRFDWDNFVVQWERWAEKDLKEVAEDEGGTLIAQTEGAEAGVTI